ncbi:DNA recombination protein RmuC [Nocardioides sp.]|uniref:DNA recombination protein RmuC n=1 Tax=Nocardioides sp. TaxID=35761 RepID=UPI003D120B19
MEIVSLFLALVLGVALGAVVGLLWSRARAAEDGIGPAVETAEVLQSLDRISDQMRELDHQRSSWQGELNQQVQDMRASTETLRRETVTLSTALRRPQVRGRWGELHLKRAVELAGLVERCDFEEQVQLDDGALRPDMVVRLSGGKCLVIDSKVPLDAFLDATGSDDDETRALHLVRHARQFRTHIDQLGAKRYWRSLPQSPEFVVLFVPGESFLSAALEADAALIEYAAQRRVVLATPTTLIALLKTVAHGWQHETLAAQAQEIHDLGRELHERLVRMSSHVDALGRSLNAAVGHYNQAVGSLESRVLVSARRFSELGVTGDDLPAPRQLDVAARAVGTAPDSPVDLDAARRAHGA